MRKIRVMLVDDNSALRRALREELAKREELLIVGEAADGLEAIDKLGELKPDVMVLDIIMPRLDGFGVLSALKDVNDAPRVLVLTALRSDDVIARAMELGAAFYMIKPADASSLAERLIETAGARAEAVRPAAERAYDRWSPDERVANLFLSIGIPAHIKGYQYLREAVRMVIDDHDVINRITKELYPGIAKRYGTSASKVERAMRHAIEVAWNRGRLDNTNQLLGYSVFAAGDRPTNGEFIAVIADKAAG